MSPSSTSQRRRCKRLLTRSRNPKIAFDLSSTPSRRWSGAPDPRGSPISLINRRSNIPASHWTRPQLAGLALFILTTRRACCRSGAQYGSPACEASLKPGCGVSMASIAGFCSKPSRCAMSRATLSNGTGRPPTSRTASGPRRHLVRASSAFAITPKRPPTGSGRPGRTTASPAYRRTSILVASRADHAEQALRKAQAELAHVTRVTTLGELTASIAHEVNQPLAAVIANAEACLRWLDRETPNLDGARRSVEWIIDDGNRASEVIRRVRALAKKTDIEKVPLDVNEVVREVIALVRGELISHQVSVRTEFAPALPMILGDRVQLQQVIINLVMNGIEAMQSVTDRPRELVIRSGQDETQQVLVSVTDCGVGISAENADRLFNAFFTTKASGMGMGLSICRSIMEAHGGRLWTTANIPHGATFQFILPVNVDTAS